MKRWLYVLTTIFLLFSFMVLANAESFEVVSKSFKNTEVLPQDSGFKTGNVSPQISWKNVPFGTKSFVLIVSDPDAPGEEFIHWLLYNIPEQTGAIPRKAPIGFLNIQQIDQGINDFGIKGYGGPWPPQGQTHRYYFTLYAMDIALNVPDELNNEQLRTRMDNHIIAQASVMGTFKRPQQ